MANSIVKLTLESNQYKRGIKEAQRSWKQFMDGIGLSVNKLTAVGAAIGAVTGALKVAKDAFNSSQANIDEWGRTIESAQSVYSGFLNALNTSDISGFLSRIDEIVSAARNAYNAMSDLQMYTAFNQRNVARSNANYQKALDEYKLNPTADNKVKLGEANKSVIAELSEAQRRTDVAYQEALRKIATERLKTKELQDKFVETFSKGTYEDFLAAGNSFTTGKGLNAGSQYYYGNRVYDGRIQERSTGKWRNLSEEANPFGLTEKEEFEFARAIKQTTEEQIQEVQRIGAQAIHIEEQIARQDRMYNRMSGNNQKPGGSGGGGRSGRGGGNVIDYAADSIEAQEVLVRKLTELWRKASAEVRDGYLQQLNEAKNDLDYMTGKKVIAGSQSRALGVSPVGLAMENPFEKHKDVMISIITPFDQFNERISYLKGIMADPPNVDVYKMAREELEKTEEAFSKFKGEDPKKKNGENNVKLSDVLGGLNSGMNQMVGGIESLGVDIPEGLKGVLSGMQSVITILSGISTILVAIEAISTADALIPFSGGGVLHAASGYVVPGRTFSGDMIPARLNAGEVVLNRAQAGNLASQLQNDGVQNLHLSATVSGTQLRFVLNNESQARGRGQYVTTNFKG